VRVLIVGDLSVVTTFRIARLPQPGSNVVADGTAVSISGVAANLAWALRGLGAEVAIVGAVGADVFGRVVLDELSAQGVDITYVTTLAAPTSLFTILVDESGERTMIGHRGASARLALDEEPVRQWSPDWCHVSGYALLNPQIRQRFPDFVTTLARHHLRCSVDLEGIAQAGIRIDLAAVTAFCNRDEFAHYFGCAPPCGRGSSPGLTPWLAPGCARLADADLPAGTLLIVKAGREGCYAVAAGAVASVPAFEVGVVDCTGAGDAFNAGFIAAMLRGLDQRAACVWGNAAAALKVGRAGPRIDLSVARLKQVIGGGLGHGIEHGRPDA
jgi:sugar/nucleoside kinase (ribokinase family)